MTKWEKFFEECIREIAKENVVLDVGSGEPFQKGSAKYKDLFTDVEYYSLDYSSHYHPDIIGDIHHLPFKDNSVGAIICKAVLEHVPEPQRAVIEMHRILRKGGKIFAYVPFLHGYHGAKNYKDYYRFTKDGIKYMFVSPFRSSTNSGSQRLFRYSCLTYSRAKITCHTGRFP